jgi:hypothetical protein
MIGLMFSCEAPRPSLSYSTGSPGEITIVVEDELWKDGLKDSVEAKFTYYVDGLPRPEEAFDLFVVNTASFRRLYETNRSIVIFNISDTVKEAKTSIVKNKWAAFQIMVIISAQSTTSAVNEFSNNADHLIELFNVQELERLSTYYRQKGDKMSADLQAQHSIGMNLNSGAVLAKNAPNFLWYRWDYEMLKGGFAHQVNQNIIIYQEPYTDTNQLSTNYIISKRDSILKKHVAGNSEGSYLSTSFRLFPPFGEEVVVNGQYAKVVRGLWRAENGMNMGGPFMSVSRIDEKSGRIVTAEGFVYAPQFDKRELMRELEAIVKSIVLK